MTAIGTDLIGERADEQTCAGSPGDARRSLEEQAGETTEQVRQQVIPLEAVLEVPGQGLRLIGERAQQCVLERRIEIELARSRQELSPREHPEPGRMRVPADARAVDPDPIREDCCTFGRRDRVAAEIIVLVEVVGEQRSVIVHRPGSAARRIEGCREQLEAIRTERAYVGRGREIGGVRQANGAARRLVRDRAGFSGPDERVADLREDLIRAERTHGPQDGGHATERTRDPVRGDDHRRVLGARRASGSFPSAASASGSISSAPASRSASARP